MNYRQWKKKYKKEHGYNPPLSEDKRQQAKALKKALKKANNTMQEWVFPMVDWNKLFKRFNYAIGQFAYQLGESLSAAGQRMMELNKDDT